MAFESQLLIIIYVAKCDSSKRWGFLWKNRKRRRIRGSRGITKRKTISQSRTRSREENERCTGNAMWRKKNDVKKKKSEWAGGSMREKDVRATEEEWERKRAREGQREGFEWKVEGESAREWCAMCVHVMQFAMQHCATLRAMRVPHARITARRAYVPRTCIAWYACMKACTRKFSVSPVAR